MNQKTRDEMSDYVTTAFNAYQKEKTDEAKLKLIQDVKNNPSDLWAIFAPTKKLRNEMFLMESENLAVKWFNKFHGQPDEDGRKDSLKSIAEICYQDCLVKDGKSEKIINPEKLTVWNNVFSSIHQDFSDELKQVSQFWDDWDKKRSFKLL